MSDNNSSGRIVNLNLKNLSREPNHSVPRPFHPTSSRSTGGSNYSRARQTLNGRSSIQMEPGLQALLIAEGQAAEMIATARAKRTELMRQAKRESQAEIEAFRREREIQYKIKLQEATQLEQFQSKLHIEKIHLFEEMEGNVKKERQSVVNYIIHCVIDQIHIRPHPNTKLNSF